MKPAPRPYDSIGKTAAGSAPCRTRMTTLPLALLALLLSLLPSRLYGQEGSYPSITGPCNLAFPQDHGPHPDHRTEWWYYTGNVQSKTGERFGFQLTFFRSRLSPPGSEREWPSPPSPWRTSQLFLAHAALSDLSGQAFHHAEDLARAAPGLAGALQEGARTTVFVKSWSMEIDGETHHLKADTGDFALQLTFRPQKPPVPHGASGYSRKGSTPERASCYYSFTRLRGEGTIRVGQERRSVSGEAWMDHEFSSAPLESGLVGWDWFSIQLDGNRELMVYLLRKADGSPHPASSGTFVDASGEVTHLESIEVQVLDHWVSSRSGGVYPSRWRIQARPLALNLSVKPRLADQEMQTPGSTRVTYWEGSVGVEGTLEGRPTSGQGYVELTGYTIPFDAL